MFLSRIAARIKQALPGLQPAPALECGDCARAKSCGQAPHDDCEEKLLQAEIGQRFDLVPRRPHATPFDLRY